MAEMLVTRMLSHSVQVVLLFRIFVTFKHQPLSRIVDLGLVLFHNIYSLGVSAFLFESFEGKNDHLRSLIY